MLGCQQDMKFDGDIERHECGIALHQVSLSDNGTWSCTVMNSNKEVGEKAIDVRILTDVMDTVQLHSQEPDSQELNTPRVRGTDLGSVGETATITELPINRNARKNDSLDENSTINFVNETENDVSKIIERVKSLPELDEVGKVTRDLTREKLNITTTRKGNTLTTTTGELYYAYLLYLFLCLYFLRDGRKGE